MKQFKHGNDTVDYYFFSFQKYQSGVSKRVEEKKRQDWWGKEELGHRQQ